MKHKRKLTAAAVASTMLLCSVFPAYPTILPLFRSTLTAYAAGSVTLDADGKTLLLNGAFTREQLDAFSENENVHQIEAKEGCILPEDCSDLFSKKDDHWLNLAAVDLKAADFSKVKTMESMFNRYLFFSKSTDFTSIEFDHPDTSNVTNMCRMFSGCSALTELDLSGMDTSKVEDMRFMFENCSGLTSLDVSSFDTENLNWMQCMFSNCSNLTVLDLHHFDTSKVDYMNGTFRGCSKLKAVNLSSFDTSMVLDMRQMFMSCSALTELDLSSFDTSNVYAIGSYTGDPEYISSSDQFGDNGMFDGCSSLQTIYVSSLWNNEKIGDSGNMFRDCTALTGGSGTVYNAAHTDIEYARIDGGKDAPGYFTESPESSKLNHAELKGDTLYLNGTVLKSDVLAYRDNAAIRHVVANEGCILPEDCSELFSKEDDHWLNLATVDLKAADFSKVKTMESMFNRDLYFSKSTDFTSIVFDHPDTSNVTNMCSLFAGNASLNELDLSGMNTSKVTDMNRMFADCSGLKSLDLSGFDTANVTDMCYLFSDCSGLTALDVSSFDTSKVSSMIDLFSGCSKLTALDLSGFDTSKVISMNGAFKNCSGLKTLDLRSFDTANTIDMRQMFMGCSALTELDLSSFDTSNVYAIGSYTGDPEYISSSDQFGDNGMFDGCSSLKTIYVSDLWNNAVIEDSGDMFRDCTALTGGSGTVYDAAHTDIGYARIDGGKDAPGYFTASNKCGKDLTWVYDPDTKTLTISGTGAMYDYQEPAKTPWYNYREEIEHIVLPEGMTTIGTCAFAWMHAVTEITVPITVTSIGMSAFELCDELEYITILNYETEIADSGWTICNVTRPTEDGHKYLYKGVIQGIANSTAEKYAEKYGYRFKAISVKIFFDPDNGKDPVEYTEHMGGAAYMLPACKFDPPAEGMVFVGWDNGNGIEAPETLIIPRSDLYYKAVWGYQNLSVSFDANGGGGNMTPVNVTSENPFIFPACGFTAPEGTFFAGWMLGDKTYQPDDTVTITKDTVVTAKWAHHIYTVHYNPNGGTGEMSDKTVEAGSEFTLPKCGFAAPEDKKFAGWLVDETVYEPGDTITISGDTEIIAAWKDSMKKMRRGDLDNDGSSDTKDAALLARFVNGWEGIEIDLEAADLDKNGTVNTRDAMILARYVNGWEGYDIYFADTEE